jgi:hypothetical protein
LQVVAFRLHRRNPYVASYVFEVDANAYGRRDRENGAEEFGVTTNILHGVPHFSAGNFMARAKRLGMVRKHWISLVCHKQIVHIVGVLLFLRKNPLHHHSGG